MVTPIKSFAQLEKTNGHVALPLNEELCRQMGLNAKSQVQMEVQDGKLIITPIVTASDAAVDAAIDASIDQFSTAYKKLAE